MERPGHQNPWKGGQWCEGVCHGHSQRNCRRQRPDHGGIEMSFVIESFVIEGLVLSSQPIEEGKFLFHLVNGLKDKQVAGGEVFDFVS